MVTDYFSLGSSTLIPVSADDGRNRPRVVTRHSGKTAGGDVSAALKWLNPVVTYMVVGDMTLALNLGTAFAAATGCTGYMITTVTVSTAVRRFPTVTVSAVANEGANAINLFPVSIPLLGRARAQNLLGVVSGGGEIQSSQLTAICDPVVCAEDLIPCASDVVNGRYELTAQTLATAGQSEPTVAPASGFVGTAENTGTYPVERTRYRITARKDIY